MSDETEAPTLVEALAGVFRAASGGVMSEGASLEAALTFIAHHTLVSLDPGQIVVGPDTDGVLVEWGPGAYEYYYEYTADGLREAMPGNYLCRPVYLGPVQEADDA